MVVRAREKVYAETRQNISLTSSQSFLLSACSVTTLTAEEEEIEKQEIKMQEEKWR